MKKQLLRWFGILLCWCLFVSCFSVPARASASGTVSISCGDGETVTIDNHSFDSELHSGGLRCQALYNDKKLVMQDGNNGVAFVEQGGERLTLSMLQKMLEKHGRNAPTTSNYPAPLQMYLLLTTKSFSSISITTMMNHFGFLNLPSIPTALIPMSSSTRKKKIVPLQPSPIREQIPFKLPFRMERRPLTPFPIQ